MVSFLDVILISTHPTFLLFFWADHRVCQSLIVCFTFMIAVSMSTAKLSSLLVLVLICHNSICFLLESYIKTSHIISICLLNQLPHI